MSNQIDENYRESMRALASAIDDAFNGTGPKRVGFALLSFEFGKIEGGRVNYISNGDRADMIVAVKEWLARAEGRVVTSGARQ
jgi:hypothetical protein